MKTITKICITILTVFALSNANASANKTKDYYYFTRYMPLAGYIKTTFQQAGTDLNLSGSLTRCKKLVTDIPSPPPLKVQGVLYPAFGGTVYSKVVKLQPGQVVYAFLRDIGLGGFHVRALTDTEAHNMFPEDRAANWVLCSQIPMKPGLK